jgi:phosphonate transport system substrate-binding protein
MLSGLLLLAAVMFLALPQVQTSAQSKLVMVFVPSMQTETVLFNGQQIGRMLGGALGMPVDTVVATSFTAAIEAMCAGRADIGALNPFGYVLAHNKCGVEVAAISVRFGLPYYRAQISARADAGVTKITDLRGKRFAFVDPASTSGYLFPAALLKKMGYDPDHFFSQTIFAGSHPNVIIAIYRGQVDAGATFEDARQNVVQQFRDVMDKIKPVAYTDPIPNDTWSLNAKLPADLKVKIRDRLLGIAQTAVGKETLKNLYDIEGLTTSVELTTDQVQQLGIRFPSDVAERIVRKGDKLTIPVGDWYFQSIRDAAALLGLDLQKMAH